MSALDKLYNSCGIENIIHVIPTTASPGERTEIISMLGNSLHISIQNLATQLEAIATDEKWTSTSAIKAKVSASAPEDLEKMSKWINLSTLVEVLSEAIPETQRTALLSHEQVIKNNILQSYREQVASLQEISDLQYLPKQAILLSRINASKTCSAETCIETCKLYTKMRTCYEELQTTLPRASVQERLTLAHLMTFDAEQIESVFNQTILEQSETFRNVWKNNFPLHRPIKEKNSIFLFLRTPTKIEEQSGKSKFASSAIKLDAIARKTFRASPAIQLNCYPFTDEDEIAHEIKIYNRLRSDNQPEELIKAYALRRADPITNSVLLYEACDGDLISLMKKLVDRHINIYTSSFYQKSLKICQDAAKALAYMHAKHIVHGDIKWENVLTKWLKGKLADFGTSFDPAKKGDEKFPYATLGYGAPESARGASIEDYFKLDIWAFGILIGNLFLDEQLYHKLCFESVGRHTIKELLEQRQKDFILTSEEAGITDLSTETLAYKRFIDNVLKPLNDYLNSKSPQNQNSRYNTQRQKIHFTLVAKILTPKVLQNDCAILKTIMKARTLEEQIAFCTSLSIFDPASRPTAAELIILIESALKELSEIA